MIKVHIRISKIISKLCELQQPTCIWTNDHRLGEILLSYGGKCKCEGNHKESVRNTPGKNFAALPDALCKIISSYVDSNIRQRKFDKLRTK